MAPRQQPEPLIGESDAFLSALEQLSAVAPLDKPVLIVGERGCGKELLASRLHFLSERWQGPLVKFNCAALHEELLDSELFGHVQGAFTGATRSREGRFGQAHGGTLFLDELSSMSARLQEKVLRVVEYGEFEPVGSGRTQTVDVRLLGAANLDLPSLARSGRFRADLLDRLSFDVITVPPLRARREDIMPLAQAFAEDMTKELDRPFFAGFSASARAQLLGHDWPGNVRELRNVVERSVYRQADATRPVLRIELDPFASPWRPPPLPDTASPGQPARVDELESELQEALPSEAMSRPIDYTEAVAALEKRLLSDAMRASRQRQNKAAERLGLSYHQLRGQLRKHGLLPQGRKPRKVSGSKP